MSLQQNRPGISVTSASEVMLDPIALLQPPDPSRPTSLTILRPLSTIEEQVSRQKSETFEVVDSDNSKFTFSVISDISSLEDEAGKKRRSAEKEHAIVKTYKKIVHQIR